MKRATVRQATRADLATLRGVARTSCVIATGALAVLLVAAASIVTRSGVPPLALRPHLVLAASDADRMLSFSGYRWRVKSSGRPVGPGPNYFGDSERSVWTDPDGRLHLRVIHEHGRWWAAEVISAPSFGHGTYRFDLETNVDDLDSNVVLGLFTWSDQPAFSHREIDIEISRWGQEGNDNAQFVVQPYTQPKNIVRFSIPRGLSGSVHTFLWTPDRVAFRSFSNAETLKGGRSGTILHAHTVTGGIARPGGENARINLWLLGGRPPKHHREIEVVVSRFSFVPHSRGTLSMSRFVSREFW